MLAIVFFPFHSFCSRGRWCGKGERAWWGENQCFYNFYMVLACHRSSCLTEIKWECWSAYLAGSKMRGTKRTSYCGIHRLFLQGWVKGSSATSAEQMRPGASSCLSWGGLDRTTARIQECFCRTCSVHWGKKLSARENWSSFQCYVKCFNVLEVFFSYIHAHACSPLAEPSCFCYTQVEPVLDTSPCTIFSCHDVSNRKFSHECSGKPVLTWGKYPASALWMILLALLGFSLLTKHIPWSSFSGITNPVTQNHVALPIVVFCLFIFKTPVYSVLS